MKIIRNQLVIISFVALLAATFSKDVFATGGRLNQDGCHTDSKTGKYHCHAKSKKKESKK